MIKNASIKAINANPVEYHNPQAIARGQAGHTMSASELRIFAQCPSRYIAGYNPPDSDAKDWGNLLDCKLLTPSDFSRRYAIKPATYKDAKTGEEKPWNGNSNVCKAWLEENGNFEVISASEHKNADDAVSRLMADEVIAAFVNSSDKQVWMSAEWCDESGVIVPLKVLLDLVPKLDSEFSKCLGDLKTTRNASLMVWQRWCFTAGYHLQAALYTDLYTAATGEDRNTFCHILSENFSPWQTGKRMLSQEFLELGRAEYRRLLTSYCACLKANKWPSYDETDESIQGSWSLVEPEPFMAERAMFAPKFNFDTEETTNEEGELTP